MKIYAYADETIFTINHATGKQAVGSAILITNRKISSVDQALVDLSLDPEIDNNRDPRTLQRGFFHASEDSKNAHSHLCNFINSNINCVFDFTYFSFEGGKHELNKIKESAFQRCLSNSSVEFFNSIEEVNLIVEARPGLTITKMQSWKDKIYKMLETSSYQIPSFKTFFPKIDISLGDKKDAGLQVVDFILWTLTRAHKIPKDETWSSRLKFSTWFSYNDEKGHTRGQYFLQNAPEVQNLDYPFKFVESKTHEELLDAYILIERFIWSIDKDDFTESSFHLYAEFEKIAARCKNLDYTFDSDTLKSIGRLYIRLFDSLPVYKHVDNSDSKAWIMLFHSKHVASLLLKEGHVHTGRTRDYILRWRYKMQESNKDLLITIFSDRQ